MTHEWSNPTKTPVMGGLMIGIQVWWDRWVILVSGHVILQHTLPRKALLANWTRVRLLSSVCADMVSKRAFLNEFHWTVRTRVGFLSSVGSYMWDQIVFPACDVRTVGTLVPSPIGHTPRHGSCSSVIVLLALLSCL